MSRILEISGMWFTISGLFVMLAWVLAAIAQPCCPGEKVRVVASEILDFWTPDGV